MNELGGYEFADLRVGMCATFAKTITEADIVLFAAVSGDNNAIHINEEFAAGTIFKGRIAHGLLSASVISAAIANKLPGPGSIYVSQSLRFRAPVRANDTVRATVTVKEMIPARFRVLLATVCTVGGLVVIEGEAVVALPAPSPPNISVRSRSKKRLPLLRRSSTEAAAGQFKVSRDTRRTGTAPTTISRRGQ
jgi:3-hydroxybutyryl-CoA dehydratase